MNAMTSVSDAPAVSASRRRSIRVEPLTCSIGALVENVQLGDAARDGELFAEIRALLLAHKVPSATYLAEPPTANQPSPQERTWMKH